jgi:ATP-dependent Clp protease, protease subunit
VYLYGAVTQESCFMLRDAIQEATEECLLAQMTYDNDDIHIDLHIQSPGGDLMAGMFMADYLLKNKVAVHSYVDGYAASSATLLSVACKKRFAYKNSVMLVHQLSGGTDGKYADIKVQVKNMDALMDRVTRFYIDHTHFTTEELKELMTTDLWLDSNKCLQYGLIDAVV